MNSIRRDGLESIIIGGLFSLWVGYLLIGLDPTAPINTPTIIYLACLIYFLLVVALSLSISLMYTSTFRFFWYFVAISCSIIIVPGFLLLSQFMKQENMMAPAGWAIYLGIPIIMVWIISLEICSFFLTISVNTENLSENTMPD